MFGSKDIQGRRGNLSMKCFRKQSIRFKSFTSLLQKKGQCLSKMMQLFKRLVQNDLVV
ncbi:unnamed protein product [Camellia sinensis]